jgi:hypothetical protein
MSDKKVVVFDAYECAVWHSAMVENVASVSAELDKIIAANKEAIAILNAPLPKPSPNRPWWKRLLLP